MSGGKQTTTQETKYDPAYMARINANYDRTKGIADAPFQAYTGERVAGFTPTQRAGQQGLLAAANDPTSANGMKSAFDSIQGLLSFKPQTVNASPYDAAQLSDTDMSPYYNPFQKDVIDASLAQNERARGIARVADNQHATAAHAFGGSRHGVADALTNEAFDRNNQQNLAELNSANFAQARSGAQFDIGNRNAARQFNSGQAFDASRTNATNDITGANMRGNAAQSLASISDQQLRQALMRAGVIQSVGDQEQAQQQNVNDAAYEEFLRMLQDPYQKQALLNSALGAYPVQGTTTSTQTNKVGLGQIIGGILGGAQTAANMGAFK